MCEMGYMGDKCDCDHTFTCSSHGTCDKAGMCVCQQGYTGPFCSVPVEGQGVMLSTTEQTAFLQASLEVVKQRSKGDRKYHSNGLSNGRLGVAQDIIALVRELDRAEAETSSSDIENQGIEDVKEGAGSSNDESDAVTLPPSNQEDDEVSNVTSESEGEDYGKTHHEYKIESLTDKTLDNIWNTLDTDTDPARAPKTADLLEADHKNIEKNNELLDWDLKNAKLEYLVNLNELYGGAKELAGDVKNMIFGDGDSESPAPLPPASEKEDDCESADADTKSGGDADDREQASESEQQSSKSEKEPLNVNVTSRMIISWEEGGSN